MTQELTVYANVISTIS